MRFNRQQVNEIRDKAVDKTRKKIRRAEKLFFYSALFIGLAIGYLARDIFNAYSQWMK